MYSTLFEVGFIYLIFYNFQSCSIIGINFIFTYYYFKNRKVDLLSFKTFWELFFESFKMRKVYSWRINVM